MAAQPSTRRRLLRRADERGFALITTMGILAATVVIIMALLSFAFSAAGLTTAVAKEHNEERAAEAALDNAINRLHRAPRPASLCRTIINAQTVTFEGRDVQISCDYVPGLAPPRVDPENALPGAPQDLEPNVITLLGATPEDEALSLIHESNGKITITGSLGLKRGSLVQDGNNRDRTTVFMYDGYYLQQFGTCPSAPHLGITSDEYILCGPTVEVKDPFNPLTYNSPVLQDVHLPPFWSEQRIEATRRTAPVCPDEKTDRSIVIPPGSYDRTETARLNQMFGATFCTRRTFHFPPGDYFFDVDDAPPRTGHLFLNDPRSNFIFGVPNWNWDSSGKEQFPDNKFPLACNQERDGVTITFSANSMLKVRDTLAAMCGDRTNWPGYVITQQRVGEPMTYEVTGLEIESPPWTGTPAALRSLGGAVVSSSAETTEEVETRSFTATLEPQEPVNPIRGLERAVLKLRTGPTPVGADGPVTAVANIAFGGSPLSMCAVPLPGVDAGPTMIEVDLLEDCGLNAPSSARRLDGMAVTVVYTVPTRPPAPMPMGAFQEDGEPPADEPPEDEPPADEPPADEPPADEPPADEPPADEPPANEDPEPVLVEVAVDHLRLDAHLSPSPSPTLEVRQEEYAGLWIRGSVHAPATDIVVTWVGNPRNESLFSHWIVAKSVTSRHEGSQNNPMLARLGVDYSGLLQQPVNLRLDARIGGRLVARSEVMVDPDVDTTRSLEIREWRRCTSTAC